jgi:hypothetical protein
VSGDGAHGRHTLCVLAVLTCTPPHTHSLCLQTHRSGLEALQQDLDRADAELKEVEGRLHELEGKNDQVAKQVRL